MSCPDQEPPQTPRRTPRGTPEGQAVPAASSASPFTEPFIPAAAPPSTTTHWSPTLHGYLWPCDNKTPHSPQVSPLHLTVSWAWTILRFPPPASWHLHLPSPPSVSILSWDPPLLPALHRERVPQREGEDWTLSYKVEERPSPEHILENKTDMGHGNNGLH